jgi:predicted deacetylase
MRKQYFFRLDDIAPNMDWDKFNFIVSLFRRYNIKPLLAIIPNNKDPELLKYPANSDFWRIIRELSQDGWVIAQHGFEHLYKTDNRGILKINKKSEFAGIDFETQEKMIIDGKEILIEKVLEPRIFIAPGHSFDRNTVRVLQESGFSYLSDGIALYPFKKWGLIWLPQILWRPRKVWLGFITVALHPNTMTDGDFDNLEEFIEKNPEKIGNFSELMNWYSRAGVLKKFFAFFVNLIFKPIWQMAFKLKYGLSR